MYIVLFVYYVEYMGFRGSINVNITATCHVEIGIYARYVSPYPSPSPLKVSAILGTWYS